MFEGLKNINQKPGVFEFYTASELWADEYVSEKMLGYHLNEQIDVSSRNINFINNSVEWINSRFEVTGKKIADFGCGPGLYSNRLASKKAYVTGIDFSKRSIEYASQTAIEQGVEVTYINQNYLEFETNEKFGLVIMIMCDFCAISPVQRKVMLEKFRRILKPGGSVLLDVYSLATYEQRQETAMYEKNQLDGFWAKDDYFGFLNTFKYDEEKVVLDKYTIIEKDRTRTIYNWLQHFSVDAITKEFGECGFEVELLGNVAGEEYNSEAGEFAVIAKIPKSL